MISLRSAKLLRRYCGWWGLIDTLSHRYPILPVRVRNWICDKFDESFQANVPERTYSAGEFLYRDILREERSK